MKFIYNDGGRKEAGRKGDADDCVTRSVVIASGLPYLEVYDYLAECMKNTRKTKQSIGAVGKRSASNGIYTTRKFFKDYMKELGFIWTPTMQIGSGCTVHLRDGELPSGRLIVNVSKHQVAVIDGEIHDTHDPSRSGTRCVYGYYSLEGATA